MKKLVIACLVAIAPLAATAGGTKTFYGSQEVQHKVTGYAHGAPVVMKAQGLTDALQQGRYMDDNFKKDIKQHLQMGFQVEKPVSSSEFGLGIKGFQSFEDFMGKK